MYIIKQVYFIRAVLTLLSCIPVVIQNNRLSQLALLALVMAVGFFMVNG